MSEPITPKAEHHVVEGEFVEATHADKTQDNKFSRTDPKAKKRPTKNLAPFGWLWLVVMLVSGSAFALALAAWLQVKAPQPGLVAAIDQQQNHIQTLQQSLAQKQQAIDELNQVLQTQQQTLAELSAQAQERGLMMAELQQQFSQISLNTMSSPDLVESPATETSTSQSEQLQQKLAQTEQALLELQQQIQRLSEQGSQQIDRAQDYVQSEQWQQDKQALQAELEQMQQQLQSLMQQQLEWVARVRPLLEQTAQEIKPQLEGIFSRFNEIFSIKKQIEADAETHNATPTDAESQP